MTNLAIHDSNRHQNLQKHKKMVFYQTIGR